jgi:sulfate transport system permease protein
LCLDEAKGQFLFKRVQVKQGLGLVEAVDCVAGRWLLCVHSATGQRGSLGFTLTEGQPRAELRLELPVPGTIVGRLRCVGVSLPASVTMDVGFGTHFAGVTWTRYRFPGRRLLDAFVDLPFALPTAVAGIALTALYAPNGWIGQWLAPLGIKVAYTPTGIAVALIFIGLPFVVRTVQPVLEEFDRELEEASATLGANRRQTVFRVMLPTLLPAILTGFALALARAVGEYGSVIFIAGNMPFISEIAPLLIIIRLEEFSYPQAAAIGTAMLMISFGLLFFVHLVQAWQRRRFGHD